MNKKCRVMVVLTGSEQMEIQIFDLPITGEEDGLLKIELVGVCGSEPGILKGKETFGLRPFPLIMRHEIVGRIARMGEKTKKRHGVKKGDRVVIEYTFGCGKCISCR